jgi:hypothetical protein
MEEEMTKRVAVYGEERVCVEDEGDQGEREVDEE